MNLYRKNNGANKKQKVISDIKDEFHTLLTVTYFSQMAYDYAGRYFSQMQANHSRKLGLSIEVLDKKPFAFARGQNNIHNNNWDDIRTQKQVKEILKFNSRHVWIIRNLIIAQIYEHWETRIRKKIANTLNKEYKEVKSNLFGDLRNLRHDILHNKHVVSKENTGENTILKWFRIDEEISFDAEKLTELDRLISTEIDCIFDIPAR